MPNYLKIEFDLSEGISLPKISYTFGKNPFVFKKNPSKIRVNPFVLKKSRTLFPMSKLPLGPKRKCINFAVDKLMKKSAKVKFYNQFNYYSGDPYNFTRPNLSFRLSEDAACIQRTLGDNDSLRTHNTIEQSNADSLLREIAGTNFLVLMNLKTWPKVGYNIVPLKLRHAMEI